MNRKKWYFFPLSFFQGEAYNHLWDYEVVELFFLSSSTGLYLEVEFGPHGQHLGLLLNNKKECLSHSFALDYQTELLPGMSYLKNTIPLVFLYCIFISFQKRDFGKVLSNCLWNTFRLKWTNSMLTQYME